MVVHIMKVVQAVNCPVGWTTTRTKVAPATVLKSEEVFYPGVNRIAVLLAVIAFRVSVASVALGKSKQAQFGTREVAEIKVMCALNVAI